MGNRNYILLLLHRLWYLDPLPIFIIIKRLKECDTNGKTCKNGVCAVALGKENPVPFFSSSVATPMGRPSVRR